MMLRVRSSPLLSTPIEGKTTGQSNCVNSAKHARRFPRDVTVVIASTDMAIQTDEELSQNMPGWAVRTQELEEELCAKSAELENARAVIVSLETKVEAVERERDGERRERERQEAERHERLKAAAARFAVYTDRGLAKVALEAWKTFHTGELAESREAERLEDERLWKGREKRGGQ